MSECAASLGKMAGAYKDISSISAGIGSCVNCLGFGRPPICRRGGRLPPDFHGDEPDYKLQPDGRHGPRNRGNHWILIQWMRPR